MAVSSTFCLNADETSVSLANGVPIASIIFPMFGLIVGKGAAVMYTCKALELSARSYSDTLIRL